MMGDRSAATGTQDARGNSVSQPIRHAWHSRRRQDLYPTAPAPPSPAIEPAAGCCQKDARRTKECWGQPKHSASVCAPSPCLVPPASITIKKKKKKKRGDVRLGPGSGLIQCRVNNSFHRIPHRGICLFMQNKKRKEEGKEKTSSILRISRFIPVRRSVFFLSNSLRRSGLHAWSAFGFPPRSFVGRHSRRFMMLKRCRLWIPFVGKVWSASQRGGYVGPPSPVTVRRRTARRTPQLVGVWCSFRPDRVPHAQTVFTHPGSYRPSPMEPGYGAAEEKLGGMRTSPWHGQCREDREAASFRPLAYRSWASSRSWSSRSRQC